MFYRCFTLWGIDNEHIGKTTTQFIDQCINGDFKVQIAGLNSKYSFLGATSDEKVNDGDNIGLLDIELHWTITLHVSVAYFVDLHLKVYVVS